MSTFVPASLAERCPSALPCPCPGRITALLPPRHAAATLCRLGQDIAPFSRPAFGAESQFPLSICVKPETPSAAETPAGAQRWLQRPWPHPCPQPRRGVEVPLPAPVPVGWQVPAVPASLPEPRQGQCVQGLCLSAIFPFPFVKQNLCLFI